MTQFPRYHNLFEYKSNLSIVTKFEKSAVAAYSYRAEYLRPVTYFMYGEGDTVAWVTEVVGDDLKTIYNFYKFNKNVETFWVLQDLLLGNLKYLLHSNK